MLIAQQLSLAAVLNALKPINFWGWLLYIVIVMDLLTMFLQKKGTLMLTIFLSISILTAFINELGSNNPNIGSGGDVFSSMLKTGSFANWMIGILMFVFPLVVAGMTKTGRSRLPAILGGIFAMIYVFGRYATMPK